MARKVKKIIENGVDKREVGYYSTPQFISDYISNEMLRINANGTLVLDPAVGKEELLNTFYEQGKNVEGFDILKYKKRYEKCHFRKMNFIDFYNERRELGTIETEYDYIIANPPYNCHEVSYIKDNKKWLNDIFEVGAYNMYSMFLSAMIHIAKEGCVIGVIISDSFLTATIHSKLREQILRTCSIHQIILCPSDLFRSQKADVRTCIMILQKGTKFQQKVLISDRPEDKKQLQSILQKRLFKTVGINQLCLKINKNSNQILIDVDKSIVDLFSQYDLIKDVFKCVTCISTGNDEKYLSPTKKKGYTVPFFKNPASRKFKTTADAYLIDDYMEESLKVKDFMVRNKSLIGNEGIACSSMGLPFSAAYLPKGSVCGVNPTIFPNRKDINWLISYLNSSLVTYLIRGVLIRSNMVTSGYVNCLPVIRFSSEEKEELSKISLAVQDDQENTEDAIKKIDEIIFNNLNFSDDVKNRIILFSKNIGRSV